MRHFAVASLALLSGCALHRQSTCAIGPGYSASARSAIAWQTAAPPAGVRGRVVSLSTNAPIHYANIRLRRAGQLQHPDSAGYVTFTADAPPLDTLDIMAIGYLPTMAVIPLKRNSSVVFVATMALMPELLEYATACPLP